MPRRCRTWCPAKLNLALAVDAPRDDGLHPIASWMLTVDFVDDLEVTMLEPDRFSRYAVFWHEDALQQSDIDWSITDDLAVRAHLALEAHVGRRLPVQMKLEKRIPVGGGLGGGSSNAAAMLRATNELFELGLSSETLEELAISIGSDVPFLVRGGSAVVGGVGDSLARHDGVPAFHAVLVLTGLSCPTGDVYRAFDDLDESTFRPDAVAEIAGSPPDPVSFFNDLAEPAMQVVPDLRQLQARVEAVAEGPVHVSGSGSSLFVPCSDSLHAGALAVAVREQLELPAVPVAARSIEAGLVEESP